MVMNYKPVHIRGFAPPPTRAFALNKFLGVDFTRGDYITDERRSPSALNTIWGVNPYTFDTRTGLKRVLAESIIIDGKAAAIWGVHIYEPTGELLVHAGKGLYRLNGTLDDFASGSLTLSVALHGGLSEKPTTSFTMDGKLYILGAGAYLEYSGITVREVGQDETGETFIPTTVINRLPSGGGIAFEAVNLLTNYRKNSFRAAHTAVEVTENFSGNGTIKDFVLAVKENITFDEFVITVNGNALTAADYSVERITGTVKFEVAPPSGTDNVKVVYFTEDANSLNWESVYKLDGTNIKLDSVSVLVDGVPKVDFAVDLGTGVVTFTTAPIATVEGVDNVEITFCVEEALGENKADRINKCTIFNVFGGANDTRVFLSGNPDYPNCDWQSGLYEPTYFPDNGYTFVGADNTAIMGYVKQYDTQMIIKEGNQQDGSAWLRHFALDEAARAKFPLEQGAVGIGAISTRAFAYLQGEPLFLSGQGVMGVSGTNVDNQRLIQDRSELVNSVLAHEVDLANAIGVEFENKYYLFVGRKVFVCDARMRFQDALGNIQYEWSYWELPEAVTAVKTHYTARGGYLLVGCAGMVYRFKRTDELRAYIDETAVEFEDLNIASYWTTPKLYFGTIAVRKRMFDLFVLYSKNKRVSAKITAIIDNERTVDFEEFKLSAVLDFGDLNFGGLYFGGSQKSFTHKQRAMIERFDNIQFKIEKVITDKTESVSFGIELLQATYQLLNN